jgi:osmoprotectant transport system ATP-binding protein
VGTSADDPSEDGVIEFESVTKRYRDGTTAVRDLNLTIPSDGVSVLVGPSGCGKTTTLRMINRMLEPTSGKITWDGKPLRSIRRTQVRRQMGYVIQSGGLFPHRTVIENIQTVPGLLGWNKAKAAKRASELMELVGLDRKLGRRYPSQLSGGQQQRVGVARALAADPVVMLMDEPFSAVDPVVRADLQDQLLSLQQQLGKTIVVITHDIDEAIKLGNQITIMRQGGVLAQTGSPQQLLEEPADDFVAAFVGKDRGYRGLSFVSSSGLPLESVQLVRDPAAAQGDGPVLVIDADANPLGWADRSRPGKVQMLGSTFHPGDDTMRAALDSALNSPVGLAVAVAENGRFAGVVTASQILDQVRHLKASVADSISARDEADAARAEAEAARAEAESVRADAARVAAEADAEAEESARVEAAAKSAEDAEAAARAAEARAQAAEKGEAGGPSTSSGRGTGAEPVAAGAEPGYSSADGVSPEDVSEEDVSEADVSEEDKDTEIRDR